MKLLELKDGKRICIADCPTGTFETAYNKSPV
jgi:hypothetical protein